MNRRDALKTAAAATAARALGAVGLAGAVSGCGGSSVSNTGTTPSASEQGAGTEGRNMEPENELQLAAAACLAAGDACLAHCLRLLSQGDTSLSACARAVVVMLPICEAVGTLADNESRHLTALAALCRDVCEDCADACEPHAGHHSECAACLEVCRRMIAVTRRVVESGAA